MKNKVILSAILAVESVLVSAANSQWVSSAIMKDNLQARRVIGSSNSSCETLVVDNQVSARMNVYSEVYETDTVGAYQTYVPLYLAVYRIDCYLATSINFKGGFLNLEPSVGSAILQDIHIQTFYYGNFSSTDNVIQTPSDSLVSGTREERTLYTSPTSSMNAASNDRYVNGKPFTSGMGLYHYSNFVSNSYSLSPSQSDITRYCSRLNATVTESKNFGYSGRYEGNTTLTFSGFEISGPSQDTNNHPDPYYFSIYGTCSIETNNAPTKFVLNVSNHTMYGCPGFNRKSSSSYSIAGLNINMN